MKPQPIRDAEWAIEFLAALEAEPQPGRIRAWLAEALEFAIFAVASVALFYGLLFLTLLRG